LRTRRFRWLGALLLRADLVSVKEKDMANPIEVKLVRSPIGRPEKHRKVLQALGLTRMNRPVNLYATPQIIGAIRKVIHLVEVKEL